MPKQGEYVRCWGKRYGRRCFQKAGKLGLCEVCRAKYNRTGSAVATARPWAAIKARKAGKHGETEGQDVQGSAEAEKD